MASNLRHIGPRLLLMALLLCLSTGAVAETGSAPQYERLAATGEFHWMGIDYTVAQFVDPTGFTEPERIFPHHLHKWNTLFMDEGYLKKVGRKLHLGASYEYRAAEMLHERPLPAYGRNDTVEPEHIVPISKVRDGLTMEEIGSVLDAYCVPWKSGVGLVAVVDQLNHHERVGVVHWVFFDLNTCEVLDAPRFVESNGGYGFRNRWMRPLKESASRLGKVRREWTKLARWSRSGRILHSDWVMRTLNE